MTRTGSTRGLALGALLAGAATAANAQTPFRIGVVEDLSGMYQGNGGPNMVLATTMAVEDFGAKVFGRPVEVLAVDDQNKPDTGSALARQLVDEKKVSALALGGASSVSMRAMAAYKDVLAGNGVRVRDGATPSSLLRRGGRRPERDAGSGTSQHRPAGSEPSD